MIERLATGGRLPHVSLAAAPSSSEEEEPSREEEDYTEQNPLMYPFNGSGLAQELEGILFVSL